MDSILLFFEIFSLLTLLIVALKISAHYSDPYRKSNVPPWHVRYFSKGYKSGKCLFDEVDEAADVYSYLTLFARLSFDQRFITGNEKDECLMYDENLEAHFARSRKPTELFIASQKGGYQVSVRFIMNGGSVQLRHIELSYEEGHPGTPRYFFCSIEKKFFPPDQDDDNASCTPSDPVLFQMV